MVKTRDVNGGNSCAAQIEIARTNPNVIMASTLPDTFTVANGLMNSDNLHYTQKGRILIGEDIANVMSLPYHAPHDLANLIGVIPILVIASIVVFAARMIIVKRND